MYLRKLWLIIAFSVGVVASPLSFGIGLGEVTLNSNLNQPLNADIRLIQVGDLTEEEILVRLGSDEDFRRRGIDRIFFLQDLRFDVQLNGPNGSIIKVTSQKPVVEPFLIFIVEIETQNSGRAQREYTLLLDLPVFDQRPAQPVQGARTQPAPQPQVQPQPAPAPVQPVTRPAPAPAPTRPQPSTANTTPPPPLPTPTEPAPAPAQPQPAPQPEPAPVVRSEPAQPLSPSLDPGATYNVRSADTLWEIALDVRPNRGVSVQQTMLALQRLNPDAFIDNNINLLKEGQVLRIPDLSEIQQLDQGSAVNEVAFQNTQRFGNPDGLAGGAELQAGRNITPDERDDDTRRGQLTLASPTDPGRASGDRSGSGLTASERDALENDLAITLEELDSAERENAELSERVDELEDQISTMERLIDVSNEELRTLQLALEQSARAETNGIEPPALDLDLSDTDLPGTLDDATDVVSVEETTGDDAAEPTTETPAATPAPQLAPAPAPVVAAPPQKSIVDTIMENILYVGIGLGAIVLLLVGFLWYRKTQADMASFEEFDDQGFDDEQMDFGGDDIQNDFDEDVEEDLDLPMDDETSSLAEDEPEEPQAPTEAQTGDAVGEADIYIAYGKYDQAEDMLQRAIVEQPGNIDARLKLLEVYSETADVSKFDGEYGKLLALGDDDASAKAAELRTAIPGAPQYQAPADATLDRQFDEQVESVSEDLGDALDLDLGDNDLGGVEETPEPTQEDDNLINFDLEGDNELSLDLDDNEFDAPKSEAPQAEPSLQPQQEDDGLDFSLDLDGDNELALDADEDELSLDLDDDEEIEESPSISLDVGDGELTLDLEEDNDLSFDLDADESEFDKEFDAVLDDDAAASDSAVNETISRDFEFEPEPQPEAAQSDSPAEDDDDDIFSDLEFSAAALASEEDKNEALAENAEALNVESADASDDSDDFDLDMGDVDLAALDEEMDALVGDLDDVDDEEVAVSPTEVVSAVPEDDDEEPASEEPSELPASEMSTLTTPAIDAGEDESSLDEDSELDFLADTDEVATKLDLARAYIDMGDTDGAKDILDEVVGEGSEEQQQEAQELLGKIT